MKFSLRRIYLNSAGYEQGTGVYYGVGAPIYYAIPEDNPSQDFTFRAPDRTAAKAKVRERFPSAKFYN